MIGMALVGAVTCRADEKTTIRDSQGRIKATITTDRNGKKTIRDSLGRIQGTETTDRNGKKPIVTEAVDSSVHARFSKREVQND